MPISLAWLRVCKEPAMHHTNDVYNQIVERPLVFPLMQLFSHHDEHKQILFVRHRTLGRRWW
jgi:hypothetical protein